MTSINYTLDRNLATENKSEQYYWVRLLMLAVIEQARLDVVGGVTDSSVEDSRKARIRSDALSFFVDGRWAKMLHAVGVGTNDMADGVQPWIDRMGSWAQKKPGCPSWATEADAIQWGHIQGVFDTEAAWQEATKGWAHAKKKPRRMQVKRLDNGRKEREYNKRK